MRLDSLPPLPSDAAPAGDGRVALDAALLKTLRKARGLSQEALADLCVGRQLPVSIASIKRAETGKVVLYRTARHLATIFDIELDALLGGGMPATGAAAAAGASNAAGSANAVGGAHAVGSPGTVGTPGTAGAAGMAGGSPLLAGALAGAADARATTGPASDTAPPAAPVDAGAAASVRYLVELHVDLGAGATRIAALADASAIAAQFGGRIDAAGAAFVIVFGLPQAYRSDAERALRCAVDLAGRLRMHGARALALRLVRWQDGQARAAAPDFDAHAARLAADRGGPALPIYAARNLLSQLDERYHFASDDDGAALPGYARYLRAVDSGQAAPAPLIGRYAETRQFQAVAGATVAAQAGHIVYLRAQPGVGKSRLAVEYADLARHEGYACHRCEVQDAGAEGWRAPLGQLARSLLGIGIDDDGGAIDATVGALALAPQAALFLRVACGARMNSEQMSLYAAMSHAVRDDGIAEALRTLINGLALRAPLLLTVEDVHWGDTYLFDALGALLASTRETPVLWVLTSRVESDPLDSALREHLYDVALTVFDLAPLGPREAQALAAQYASVDADYRARCIERAQGNPLFLTQLLASPGHSLPDSLRHLIQARLDALAPLQQRALRMAAVIGNRFELALLREALGEPEFEPEAAGRSALLRRQGASCSFVHDLVMHCVYDAIEPQQRRRLHLAVAALYRERDPALSAQHLYRADDPAAFDMTLRAIRDKIAAHAYEAALELTAQCSANDSTRFSSFALALLKAHATAGLGHMAQAQRAYEHALLLAGRPHEKIDAVIGLAGILNIVDQLDEEERLLDDTLPLARSVNADAGLAKLLHLKGNIYFPRGNYSACRLHHEEAVIHARASGATETEARALSGLGDSYYAQGRMQQAHALFGECIAMCEQHRYINIEASNRAALGSTALYLGQSEAALSGALQSAALAHKVGNKRAEIFARMTAGWVLIGTGALTQAHAEVERALALTRSMGASRFDPFLMESQARIAWQRGEHKLAEQLAVDAAETMERLRLHRFIGPWVLGTLALFTSDAAVRKKALLQGAAYLTRDCLAHNGLRFFVSAAEVALLDGDFVSADFYAAQLADVAPQAPCKWSEHHVSLIRAHAQWQVAPSDAGAAALRALDERAQLYGFAHATPRLRAALSELSTMRHTMGSNPATGQN